MLDGVAHGAVTVDGAGDSLAEQLALLGVEGGQVSDDLDLEGLVAFLGVVLDGRAAHGGLEILAQGLGQTVVGGQSVAGGQGDLHQLTGRELARAHTNADLGARGVAADVLTGARALGPHGVRGGGGSVGSAHGLIVP